MDSYNKSDFMQFDDPNTSSQTCTPIRAVVINSFTTSPKRLSSTSVLINKQNPFSLFNKKKILPSPSCNKFVRNCSKKEYFKPSTKISFPPRVESSHSKAKKVENTEFRNPTRINLDSKDLSSADSKSKLNRGFSNTKFQKKFYLSQTQRIETEFQAVTSAVNRKEFPKREIKRGQVSNSKNMKINVDIQRETPDNKSKLPLKPCLFNLKRRYYPIKNKSRYVPRHFSPYLLMIKTKSKTPDV